MYWVYWVCATWLEIQCVVYISVFLYSIVTIASYLELLWRFRDFPRPCIFLLWYCSHRIQSELLNCIFFMLLFLQSASEKHKINVPETMNEFLDMSDDEGIGAKLLFYLLIFNHYLTDFVFHINTLHVLYTQTMATVCLYDVISINMCMFHYMCIQITQSRPMCQKFSMRNLYLMLKKVFATSLSPLLCSLSVWAFNMLQ